MNKLLILLLLSTPLFAEDDLVDIEDKVLVSEGFEVFFSSDGNFTSENKSTNEVRKGVWESKSNFNPELSGLHTWTVQIIIYSNPPFHPCPYGVKKIATTYVFQQAGIPATCSGHHVDMLMQETEWSKANLPQKLDEYKNRTD